MRALFAFLLVTAAWGAEFKKVEECTTGRRVMNRDNAVGSVVGISNGMCRVKFDQDGKEISYLHWMLHPAGSSQETDDRLIVGRYECWAGSAAAGFLRITGPDTYENVGKTGKFRVEPSRKIVFLDGPLAAYHAKLLAGPRVGMNQNGSNFYGFVCGPPK